MTIWKYTLEILDQQIIAMPRGAKILSVQIQHGKPALWAMVQPEKLNAERRIQIFGTGHPIPAVVADNKRFDFVGTIQVASGSLVFHVFDLGEA